jgi:hypothetical protein
MTLIELLVSIFVIGSIVAVLAATVTVTFRQQEDTQGRLDVARWGQSLALWLPTDLASAFDVKDVEVLDPVLCPSAECTFGSNALWLSWNDGTGETTVSYRYGPAGDGVSFILTRVECKNGVCSSRVVLRDLLGPVDSAGNPVTWNAGDKVPNEVIDVTVPLAVLGPPTTDPNPMQGARRVIVNVNGAPGVDGADRSSSVSFTAGGASFETLPASTFTEPTFLPASSGCGGPVTLIVDESGSLTNADIDAVQDGVRSFVKAFEGTPTRLQIILFDTRSEALGAGGSWNKFFDLADPPSVDILIGTDGNSGLVDNINDDGGTNWEDAFFRAWFKSNGDTYDTNPDPNAPTPELIVFFTDGVPTFDRQAYKSDSTTVVNVPSDPEKWTYPTAGTSGAGYGNDFSPRGWYRANEIADQIRDHETPVRLIGVGVGDAFDEYHRIYSPRTGWPTSPDSRNIPNEEFLGDLVGGDDVSLYDDDAPRGFIKREFVAGTGPGSGWGDVSTADLLVTDDWAQFGGALTAIALADCGGTLSVQTRDQAGDPADAEITYQIGTQTVTTTRVVKAATFDINLAGIASSEVVMRPQPFDATGYTAQAWGCRAAGADLVAGASIPVGDSGFRLIDPLNPMAGIGVTVSGNAAVSCTLRVTP